MSNPYTTTRQEVAAMLATNLSGVTVYDAAPHTVGAPCAAVMFSDSGQWIATMGNVHMAVGCFVSNSADNSTVATNLEQLVYDTRQAIWASGLTPGEVDKPDNLSDMGALVAFVPIMVRADCN